MSFAYGETVFVRDVLRQCYKGFLFFKPSLLANRSFADRQEICLSISSPLSQRRLIMILIEILLLVVIFKTIFFVLKANKKKQIQEQKAQELALQQQARLAARLAREAERKAAFERKAQEQKAQRQAEREAQKLAKIQERQAREAELISKYLSSERSKKLGLSKRDVTITYVTETVTYKNGNTKTVTYPKVVRV